MCGLFPLFLYDKIYSCLAALFRKERTDKMKQKKGSGRKQRLIASVVSGLLMAVITVSITATPISAAYKAGFLPGNATEEIPIALNGRRILEASAYLIDSTTYVPLRAFCDAVDECSIWWDGQAKTAVVERDGLYLTAHPGESYISVNGRYFYTDRPVINLDGRVYLPVRPMAKAFSLDLVWDSEKREVKLFTTGKRTKWASEVYDDDDLYWLSRIINAEAGSEPFLGKIAVGNVVLNRVESPLYPNSVYGVVFDRKYGLQFSPVADGSIYRTPSKDSVIAAKICLEGYSLTDTALYFLNPRIATSFWIVNSCAYEFSLGRHDFYG